MLLPKLFASAIQIPFSSHSLTMHKRQHKSLLYAFSQNPKPNHNNKSQMETYTPIRPLKKQLTPLYYERNFLDKGQVIYRIPFWPYLLPFYAMLANNFLTEWTLVNGGIASLLLCTGLFVRLFPTWRREQQIVRLETNPQMTKFYITVPYSWNSLDIRQTYPLSYKPDVDYSKLFTEAELTGKEYQPTEEEKKTLTDQELEQKRQLFDKQLFSKILKQQKYEQIINRFELNASKTHFKFAKDYNTQIKDSEIRHPTVESKLFDMFSVPFKYLIVRTEFSTINHNKPMHFYMDLEENGDPRYHDYLTALGSGYKILLAQGK